MLSPRKGMTRGFMTPPIVQPGSVSAKPKRGMFGELPQPQKAKNGMGWAEGAGVLGAMLRDLDGGFGQQNLASEQERLALQRQEMEKRAAEQAELQRQEQIRRLMSGMPGLSEQQQLLLQAGAPGAQKAITEQAFAAPEAFKSETDALGRLRAFDPNTGTYGEAVGGVKPETTNGIVYDPTNPSEVLADHRTPTQTGEMTDYQREQLEIQRREAAAAEAAAAASASQPDAGAESTLRKEFLKQTEDFSEVQRAYDRIKSTDTGTPAGQVGLIFQIMKMYDPASTVREGEFATAQNTTGIPGQFVNAYNKALSGDFLTPEQVGEFSSAADNLYGAIEGEFVRQYEQYQEIAQQYEYDPDRTIPDLRNPDYQIAEITSDEEYDQLPPNTRFKGPDGQVRVKPNE